MFFMDFQTVRRLGARKFLVPLEADVPAVNSASAGAYEIIQPIQDGWHFWSEVMTISFTTLADDGTDDGVCYLRAQFRDGANQVALSSTYVDLSTLSAPGRQRSVGVAGDPSNQLATVGIPFPHLWLAKGSVNVNLSNSSETANHFAATLNGYIIPESNLALFDQWIAGVTSPGAGIPAPL